MLFFSSLKIFLAPLIPLNQSPLGIGGTVAELKEFKDLTDDDWERIILRHLNVSNVRIAWDRYVQASNSRESRCSNGMLEELVNRIYQFMVDQHGWDPIADDFSRRITENELSAETSNTLENLYSRLLVLDDETDPDIPYILTPECERARVLENHFAEKRNTMRRRHRHLHLVRPSSGRLAPV